MDTEMMAPLVVGTANTREGLARAQALSVGEVDLVELRLDALADHVEAVMEAVPKIAVPLLLTVRHPKEGGVGSLTLNQRRILFRQFLPSVQWVDVEARSLRVLEEEIALAKALKVRLVVSDHHFGVFPRSSQMRRSLQKAMSAQADIFKLAAQLRDARELERLLRFLNQGPGGKLAVMGMGDLGPVSRLVCGACGSVLNYGYLDRPQVAGQWEARLLKARLRELRPT
jgi:3-dehydroquinate dehydratase-1